jgi:hypothetical protein
LRARDFGSGSCWEGEEEECVFVSGFVVRVSLAVAVAVAVAVGGATCHAAETAVCS